MLTAYLFRLKRLLVHNWDFKPDSFWESLHVTFYISAADQHQCADVKGAHERTLFDCDTISEHYNTGRRAKQLNRLSILVVQILPLLLTNL